jgi:hypothetical protein
VLVQRLRGKLRYGVAAITAAVLSCALVGGSLYAQDNAKGGQDSDNSSDVKADGRGSEIRRPNGEQKSTARSTSGSNGINYHGGPVIVGTTNIHYIWYGNWTLDGTSDNPTTILTDFANSLGGSPYFNINTTYYNGSGTHVSNAVNLADATTDNYSRGKNLADADILSIVAAHNPTDTNGIYFVLTSSDVGESSGFCTQYCAWHSRATINGKDIRFGFVGDPTHCAAVAPYFTPLVCEEQTTGPNGPSSGDGMASLVAHETEEAVTDPDLNAWFDRQGAENADKCAWTFGSESTAANGAKYNMTLSNPVGPSRNYLIQQNWVNASGGFCAKSH